MSWFKSSRSKKIAAFFLIFIVALLLRLYKIGYKNIWMDEDYQTDLSQGAFFDLSKVDKASLQNQPPIDLFIQSIGISNFGLNEIGIRLHAAILGALSVLLFYIMISRIINNQFAVIIATCIFTFHPWLIRYSQEARPISICVFFAVLYLYVLIHFLIYSAKMRAFIILTIVQAWFLLSTGFQPIIFILASSISLIPFLFNKKYMHKILYVYLSGIISFLLAYPILRLNIASSSRYLNQSSITDMIVAIFKNFDLITIKNYIKYYRPLINSFELLYLIILFLGILGLLQSLVSKNRKNACFLFLYFIIFSLTYPLLFEIIFKSIVKYHVQLRYYLSFTPVIVAGITIGLYYALSFTSHLFRDKRQIRYLPHSLFLIIFILSFYGNIKSLEKVYTSQNREWTKVYDIFKYSSTPGDIAYMFNLGYTSSLPFYSTKFYYANKEERPVKLRHANLHLVQDYRNIHTINKLGSIYFVTVYGTNEIKKSYFKNSKNIKVHKFNVISVVQIINSSKLKEDILNFFNCLAIHLPQRENNYELYEILFNLDLANGNLKNAKRSLDILIKIHKSGKLKKNIDALKNRLQLSKTAMQSSTYLGAEARRAVDGNINGEWASGSVSHTRKENNPWWQIDLGQIREIKNITIFNRTDACCIDKFSNFHVFVSKLPFESTLLEDILGQPDVFSYYCNETPGISKKIEVNCEGRYVRIQLFKTEYLHLAEVEIK